MEMNSQEVDAVIDRAACAMRDMPIPRGPSAAIVEGVRRAGGQAAVAKLPTGRLAPRSHRYAGMAAVLAVAIALLGWLNWGNGRSGVAFGDVAAKLRQVRTVTCRTITQNAGMPDTITRDIVDMEGKFSRSDILVPNPQAPAGAALEVVVGTSIYNQGRILNLDPEKKTADLFDYAADGLPHTLANNHTLADLVKIDPQTAQSLGRRMVLGRECVGFTINRDSGHLYKRTLEVWVDPESRLPVRIVETSTSPQADTADIAELSKMPTADGHIRLSPEEADEVMGKWPKVTTTRVITDITFDVPVDDSTFSLEPPKGYVFSVTKIP